MGTLLNVLLAKIFLLLGLWLLPILPAYALTELLTVHLEIGCHILSIGVVTFYSFLGHKYFSFNEGIRAFWKKREDLMPAEERKIVIIGADPAD